MKRFTKFLVVLLSLIMLITALPIVSAGAQPVYEEIQLNVNKNIKLSGDDVTLSFTPQKDGWYAFSSINYAIYATLYDGDFQEVGFSYDLYDNSLVAKLVANTTYYLEVNSFGDLPLSAQLCVQETTYVESMNITQYPTDMTCIEGCEKSTVDLNGLKIDFIFSDGTVESWEYSIDIPMVAGFGIKYLYDKDENGEFCFEVVCGEARQRIEFNVLENPVESIELVTQKPFEFYQNTHGYEFDSGHYIYEYDFSDDDYLKINYKDGTTENLTNLEYSRKITITDTQDETPWELGTNYFAISYLGVETQIPVAILESPVKSVTVNSAPTCEYIYGDEKWGYKNQYGRYEFYPTDIRGLSFTVEYLDGTVEVIDDSDIDMENETIGDTYYEVNSSYVVMPMTAKASLTYKGYVIKYNVNVVKSPVASIEILWGPDNCYYEYRYFPIFDGTEIRVTFTDGTEKIIKMSDENTSYGTEGDLIYTVKDGDTEIRLYMFWYEDSYDTMFGFTCIDKNVEFDGFYYLENRDIADIKVEKFTPDGDGMVLNVTYADGSNETLSYETVSFGGYVDDVCFGYAKTENGIVHYRIEKKVKNGKVVSYEIQTLDEIVEFKENEFDIGDVDMDGKVTVMDATAIQMHLAEIKELSGEQLLLADANKDGRATILDATHIQQFLAEIIPEL